MVAHLSVQSLCIPVCHRARVPLVITVASGAHFHKQLHKIGTTTRLNLCSMHLMSLHPSDGVMYFSDAYPSANVALKIRVSCIVGQERDK